MDQDRLPLKPGDEETHAPSGRRSFLRQVGLTGVAAAAWAGIGDVVGLTPAHAASKGKSPRRVITATIGGHDAPDAPDATQIFNCDCTPGKCPGGPCHPDGVWCHECTWVSGGYCAPNGYYCIEGCSMTTLQYECG